MAGTKGEEAIVEGHGEIGGRKRVANNMNIRIAKRGKVEGKEAADRRNLAEGEVAGDGTQQEEEIEDLNNKLERLRALLENNPLRLRNKDVEDLIRHLKVEDIVSLGMRIDQSKGSSLYFYFIILNLYSHMYMLLPMEMKGKTISDYGYLEAAGPFAPSFEKVARLLRLMLLHGVEKLKAVDLYIVYNNFPKAPFAFMLLHALDSYSKRLPGGHECVYLKEEETRVTVCKLCHVLPWKLFAHVMYDMTSLPVFKFFTAAATTSEENENEEEEETDDENLQKKAAESCEICYGKGKHGGVYGYYCSFWDSVSSGLPVGPSHMIVCIRCCVLQPGNTLVQCCCGSEIGQARPRSVRWKGF